MGASRLLAAFYERGEDGSLEMRYRFAGMSLENVNFRTCVANATHVLLLNDDLSGLVATLAYDSSLPSDKPQPFIPEYSSTTNTYTARFAHPPGWRDSWKALTGYTVGELLFTNVNEYTDGSFFVVNASLLLKTDGVYKWSGTVTEPSFTTISTQNRGGRVPVPLCALTSYNGSHILLTSVKNDAAAAQTVVLSPYEDVLANGNRIVQNKTYILASGFSYGVANCPSVFAQMVDDSLVMFGETTSGSQTAVALRMGDELRREEFRMEELAQSQTGYITSHQGTNLTLVVARSQSQNQKLMLISFPPYRPNNGAIIAVWSIVGVICAGVVIGVIVHIIFKAKSMKEDRPLVAQAEFCSPPLADQGITPDPVPVPYSPAYDNGFLDPVNY